MPIKIHIPPRPRASWRSVVVYVPFYLGKADWGARLRAFADRCHKRFGLPKRPRVWLVGVDKRFSCHLFVYNDESDTPANRILFRRVLAYSNRYAPRYDKTKAPATDEAMAGAAWFSSQSTEQR